jgi:hypothetical protein
MTVFTKLRMDNEKSKIAQEIAELQKKNKTKTNNFLKTSTFARSDFQNLFDDMEKVHLFIDPITTDTTFTDSGYENETYTGKMMLLVHLILMKHMLINMLIIFNH